jgi:WD40 repeat protein
MALLPSVVHEWHEGPVKALDAAGSVIASGGADGVVRMMAVSGEHRGSYRHSDLVNAVAVRPDGAVASGSRDRTIRLWQPAHERSYEVGAHDHWVMCIAWSPTGDQLVTGSEDGTLAFWDPDGAGVSRVDADYTVNGVDWKGDLVAAATGDRRLLLLTGGEIRREIRGATQMLWSTALSPDGHTVAWTGRDRRLWLAPVDGEATAVPAHRNQVWAVTWHPTGEALFTASADRTVAKWTGSGSRPGHAGPSSSTAPCTSQRRTVRSTSSRTT